MEAQGNYFPNGNHIPNSDTAPLYRSDFPYDFIFGTASSAYQYEGAANKGGRGPSIWDSFSLQWPGKISDGKNGNVAIDFYNQFKDDVKIMKKMGLDAFRFSISWSRVLPRGNLTGGVNKEGVKFYNDVIDELLANGIRPYVTIFHWDVPQALEDEYGGFLSSLIVPDFCEFAELCFWEFGDRVKHWITLNEPWTFSTGGYVNGILAPGRGPASSKPIKPSSDESMLDIHMLHRCNTTSQQEPCNNGNPGTEPYIVTHNLLLSHAAAVAIYREKYQECQNGKIGLTLITNYMVPNSNSKVDLDAAERALDFMFGWYMDPVVYGHYPDSMQRLVGSRLPLFSEIESEKLKGSYDFIGINYYTSQYVSEASDQNNEPLSYSTDAKVNLSFMRDGVPIGRKTISNWLYIYPQGIHDLLVYTKKKYKSPLIYITENGVAEANDPKLTLKQARADGIRKDYMISHLQYIQQAIEEGVKVKGYFAWSLMDNYEWAAGYTVRFGMIYINYNDGQLSRYPKDSAIWFMKFLHEGPKKIDKDPMKFHRPV